MLAMMMAGLSVMAQNAPLPADSTVYLDAEMMVRVPIDTLAASGREPLATEAGSSLDDIDEPTVMVDENSPYGLEGKREFNPDPTRAVWLSALCPGLGQIYNRRYWKIPIVAAGFMGLGYGYGWNNGQYSDYSRAYTDLMDDDPDTKSYMNFFPSTTDESSLDKNWLKSLMKQRKDFYRRNRDLCLISMVGVYLLCIVDAYVDAQLTHFDISPSLSMDLAPAMIQSPYGHKPQLGVHWAFTF